MNPVSENHSFNVNAATVLQRLGHSAPIQKAIILKELYNACKWRIAQGKTFEGFGWWTASAENFKDKFPYMEASSISRWLKDLQDAGLLYGECLKGYDRTKSYTVNYDGYDALCMPLCEDISIYHFGKWIYHFDKSIYQNDKSIYTHSSLTEREGKAPKNTEPSLFKLADKDVKLAPTDIGNYKYKQKGYPASFTAIEITDSLSLYLSNPQNVESIAAEVLMPELKTFTQEEWAAVIARFVEYNFDTHHYQSAFNKDFPAVHKNFKFFLKRNKGNVQGKQRPSLPTYEDIQALAQSAAEKNAAPIAKVIRAIDFNALLESTGATIIALTDQMKVEPITAQEFVQLAIMHKGNKNAIVELLGTVSTAKRETRWLDGYKTLFAAIKAQYDFKNKK